MFEGNADNPWVIETLSWWNEYVRLFSVIQLIIKFLRSQVPALRPKANKGKQIQIPQADLGPSAAERIAAQLRAGKGTNKFDNGDQARIANRQTLPYLSPPRLLTWSLPPFQPKELSYLRSCQHTQHTSDKIQECSNHTGRLTSTVNWRNPDYSDYDNVEWCFPVPKANKRKVGILVVDEESETEPESQNREEHRQELNAKLCKQRKRWKEEVHVDETLHLRRDVGHHSE